MQQCEDLVVAVDVGRVFCVVCSRFTAHQALIGETGASRRDPVDEHRLQCRCCSLIGSTGFDQLTEEGDVGAGAAADGRVQSDLAGTRRPWRARIGVRVDA